MSNKNHTTQQHRVILQGIAQKAMLERGLLPDFAAAVLAEVDKVQPPPDRSGILDLTDLLWASIDNDDSRDLDQLTIAEALPDATLHLHPDDGHVSVLRYLSAAL